MVDESRARADAWRDELEAAGYDVVVSAPDDARPFPEPDTALDALVVVAAPGPCRAWQVLDAMRCATPELAAVPVVVIVGAEAVEDGLRAAIEGAARCLAEPVAAHALVAALDAVLAADAPPPREQQRVARQRALAALARIEARGAVRDDDARLRTVHLTRLERRRGPAPVVEPEGLAEARRRVATLTTKQRGLLHLLEAEGGVAAAAARLGTSRGNVYAGLRRIVHRLGVRDTAELVRLVGSGELLRAGRS